MCETQDVSYSLKKLYWNFGKIIINFMPQIAAREISLPIKLTDNLATLFDGLFCDQHNWKIAQERQFPSSNSWAWQFRFVSRNRPILAFKRAFATANSPIENPVTSICLSVSRSPVHDKISRLRFLINATHRSKLSRIRRLPESRYVSTRFAKTCRDFHKIIHNTANQRTVKNFTCLFFPRAHQVNYLLWKPVIIIKGRIRTVNFFLFQFT